MSASVRVGQMCTIDGRVAGLKIDPRLVLRKGCFGNTSSVFLAGVATSVCPAVVVLSQLRDDKCEDRSVGRPQATLG